MTKQELTKENVLQVLDHAKPGTMADLARALGRSGSVSSWLRAKLTELVPDIASRIEANKAATPANDTAKDAEVSAETEKPAGKSKAPARAASNPFRAGGAYATCYDVLAANPKGIERPKLVETLARLTGKDAKRANFDVTVVASVRKDGGCHPTIRRVSGVYHVERTDAGLRLVVRGGKAGCRGK